MLYFMAFMTALDESTIAVALETGVPVNTTMFLAGAIGLASTTFSWSLAGYGPMDASLTTRWVVPSMTCMVLSSRLSFASFLFGLFGLATGECRRQDSSPR